MPEDVRVAIELDDDEDGRVHAVWSRSGKHLIIHRHTRQRSEPMQVELRPDQVSQVIEFLSESVERRAPAGRRSDG